MVTYWIETGVVSTAAGAWATTALSGRVRILVWAAVTAALTVAAIFAAEPVIALLSRCYRATQIRRPPSAQLVLSRAALEPAADESHGRDRSEGSTRHYGPYQRRCAAHGNVDSHYQDAQC
jgi:hypothetical protein